MGALYGGKFDFTAYACWNGQDSWLDAPTYAFVNRYGYVSYKYSTSQWASGSDTHYRVVARYAFANGSVCIQTTNDIVVNRNGVFSADTSEQGYSCYVSTVLENGYYGIRNYSYVE
jgi:hypothetical protein